MTLTISAQTDSLWKVAYGEEPALFEKQEDKNIPEGTPKNRAADAVIKRHMRTMLCGKIWIVVGSVIAIIGIIFVVVYSLSTANAASSVAIKVKEMSAIVIGIGNVIVVAGAYVFYRNEKNLEDDRRKPLAEIIFRLGKDLAEIENREFENAFERQAIMTDWQILLDALMPYAKKA